MHRWVDLPVQRLNPSSRDVGTLVPTLSHGEQARVPFLVHALAPIILAFLGGFEASNTVLLDSLECLFNPFSLELSAARAGTEGCGCLRTVQEEHIYAFS